MKSMRNSNSLALIAIFVLSCALLPLNAQALEESPVKLTSTRFQVPGYGQVWLSYYTGQDGQSWPKAHAVTASDDQIMYALLGVNPATGQTDKVQVTTYRYNQEERNPYLKREYNWYLIGAVDSRSKKVVWGKLYSKVRPEELR